MKKYHEEHQLLRDSLRQFIEKEITPNLQQWEDQEECPKHLFKKMGELGFIGANFPEEVGGSGMDFLASEIVMAELSYANIGGFTGSYYAHTFLPLPLLNAMGTDEQKDKYLRPAIQGDMIASLAITEPGAGSDVKGISTFGEDAGDHFILNGSKIFITNANIGDFMVVVTRTGEGHKMTLLIVENHWEGVSCSPIDKKLGWHTSDTAQVFFDNVKVPKENVIGEINKGFYYLMNNIQEERLLMSVMATHTAQYAYDEAVKYVRDRKAFGSTLSKLQVMRHKIAKMATQLESCHAMTDRALLAFMDIGPKATEVITMSKVYTAETAMEIINQAIQAHGGNGYVETYGVARAWRDTRLFSIGAGSSEIMYEIISKFEIDRIKHEKQFVASRSGKMSTT
ncbi:acyl-CoA dehydrogenase family protein [Persicobacter psychrovividus]|uniref:Acyl-CoA dehydrogenase n=1 Tax=Persicobacter psychrovividus TaxID=387638 RepID=A0ABN6L9W0_9BACT|nr:acyl-CoA dehydrogenase [Persicobacter psychrovividus]